MALATSAMMAWGLGRIAFWLDESATATALQRTWPNLRTLMHGAEAPLVPYYAMLKVFSTAVRSVVPAVSPHSEVLLRLPSVVATVVAAWALIGWMARFCPPRLVVSTAAVLLLIGGLSRYGQEARPYALVLCLAVLSTLVWVRMIDDRSRRWIALYSLTVAAMIVLHNLAVGLVAAHLVAAVAVSVGWNRRRSALVRTLAGAVPALLITLPLAVVTARNGVGAQYYPPLDLAHATNVFVRLITYRDQPFLRVGPVVFLAAIGLTRVNSVQYRFIARLAAAWALVPLAFLLLVVAVVSPNLLFGRYVLFVVPAWAILAGLGVVTLMELIRWAFGQLPSRGGPALGSTVAVAVAVAVLAGLASDQWQTLTAIRTAGGHGEDIRPALAAAHQPEYAALPIVVSSQLGAAELSTYDRSLEHRMAGLTAQRTQSSLWPSVDPYPARKLFLSRRTEVILMERSRGVDHCEETLPITPAAQLQRCMPGILQRLGYRVTRVEPSGYGWAFAILQRS